MPGWARPVRIFCSSVLKASIERAIFCSAVFLMSAMVMAAFLSLYVDERSLVLAENDALERSRLEDAEDPDRQLLVPAQCESSRIHDLQVARDGLVERDPPIA